MFKTISLAVGLLLGLIIGSDPMASYTPLPSKASPTAKVGGVSTATSEPLDLGWLIAAKESTVVVATPRGHGSGVVVKRVGTLAYILTAKHVVDHLPEGSNDITLIWASGDTDFQRTGYLLRKDECGDMALIMTYDPQHLLRAVPLACCITNGYAIAIGYPESIFPPSVTIGEIVEFGVLNEWSMECCTFTRMTTPIWFGNSGGPLFNMRGELIGINVMISGYNGHAASDRGWAVSLEDIREFLGE